MVFVDPKVLLANERTYIAWTHMSVSLGGIAAGLLSASVDQTDADTIEGGEMSDASKVARMIGSILMPVAMIFSLYAAWMFSIRNAKIRRVDYTDMAPRTIPLIMGFILILALVSVLLVDIFVGGNVSLK